VLRFSRSILLVIGSVMQRNYVDGVPLEWDPGYTHADFCREVPCPVMSGERRRWRERSAGGVSNVKAHWQMHVAKVIADHPNEWLYPRDWRFPMVGPFMPARLVRKNRAQRRSERGNTAASEAADRTSAVAAILNRPRNHRLRDPNSLTEGQRRDAALSLLDDKATTRTFRSTATGDDLDAAIRNDDRIATLMMLCENDAYRSGFKRALLTPAGTLPMFTDRERRAMVRVDDYERAQSEITDGAGKLVVPPTLDASVTLSDITSTNIFARLCKTVDVTTNEWTTVASPGPAWAIKGQGAPATDASKTDMSQVAIPVNTASGVVEISLELLQDWPDAAAHLSDALTEGYSELVLSQLSAGSGVNECTGITTALGSAATVTTVAAGSSSAISDADITGVWQNLAAKFRERSTWMANASCAGEIRQNSKLYHASTVTLDGSIAASEVLLSKQFVENAYLPDFATTASATPRLIVGDWSKFVWLRRAGMTLETVATIVDSTRRPTGQRSVLAYARLGSDVLTPNAFRALSVA
jgi:HK97 family phage major capsid protein